MSVFISTTPLLIANSESHQHPYNYNYLYSAITSGQWAEAKGREKDDPGCPSCLSNAAGLFAQGKTLQAADLLRSWKNKCPDNLQLRLLLNTILMRLGNSQAEALDIAREATALTPDSALAHFQYAMTLMSMGRGPEATASFERVVALDPANYEAWLSLSEIYAGLGEADKARSAQTKAASLSPSTRSGRTRTIKSLHRAGNISGVQAEVRRLFGENLEPEFFLGLADELIVLGYYNEAEQCLNKYIESTPASKVSTTVNFNLALCRYLGGNFSGAAAILSRVQSQRNEDVTALKALLACKDCALDEAQRIITANGAGKSSNKLMQLAAGELAMRQGNYKSAREHFNNSAADARLAVARLRLAEIAMKTGDTMDAISSAEELTKLSGLKMAALSLELRGRLKSDDLDNSNVDSLINDLNKMKNAGSENQTSADKESLALMECALAMAHSQNSKKSGLSDINLAQQEIKRAAELDEKLCEVHLGLAAIAEKLGRQSEVKAALEKALLCSPGDIEALSRLGLILAAEGDGRGETMLARACEEGDPGARFTFALGKIMAAKGKQEARSYLERSLESGLSDPEAGEARAALKNCKTQ